MGEKLYTAGDLAHYYELGFQHGWEGGAAAGHEADISWRRTAEQSHEDRKTVMLRQFEQAAHRFHERELGKPYVERKGVTA